MMTSWPKWSWNCPGGPKPATLWRDVWIALRASLRSVLEEVTLADLASGELPESVEQMTRDPEAWQPHSR